MSKVTNELLCDLLDALVDHPVHKEACKRVGIERRTFYRAMDNPEFVFEWNGKTQHFAKHVHMAMRMNAMDIEAYARAMAVEGFEEIVTKDGKICYYENEDIINAGDANADSATLMLLYGQPDIYLRDPVTKARIPIKVKRAPPAALVTKMLAAHFPKMYGEKSEVTHKGNQTSVLVVDNKKPAVPVDVTPKQIVQQAPPPAPEDVAEPAAPETAGICRQSRQMTPKATQ